MLVPGPWRGPRGAGSPAVVLKAVSRAVQQEEGDRGSWLSGAPGDGLWLGPGPSVRGPQTDSGSVKRVRAQTHALIEQARRPTPESHGTLGSTSEAPGSPGLSLSPQCVPLAPGTGALVGSFTSLREHRARVRRETSGEPQSSVPGGQVSSWPRAHKGRAVSAPALRWDPTQ